VHVDEGTIENFHPEKTIVNRGVGDKDPAKQISVPNGKTVTGNFYENVVIKQLKKYYKLVAPKRV
jgi:hypothetical protein